MMLAVADDNFDSDLLDYRLDKEFEGHITTFTDDKAFELCDLVFNDYDKICFFKTVL